MNAFCLVELHFVAHVLIELNDFKREDELPLLARKPLPDFATGIHRTRNSK